MRSEIATIVRALLQLPEFTQETLGEALGVHQSTINRWQNGSEPKHDHYDKVMNLARKKGVTNHHKLGVGTLAFDRKLPLSGYVGAGATVIRLEHDTSTDVLETAEIPVGFGDVTAYKVRGDSMYPAYQDGDILCFRAYDGGLNELIGRECILRTEDDRWFIKRLERGSLPGHFNLFSHNAEPIRDARVVQAAPVRYVIKA